MKPIVCIGTINHNTEVNAYYSTMHKDGKKIERPCIEIRKMNSVQMLLQDVRPLIDLLEEAIAHFQEEGYNV
jgi:hypothetical protein